MILSEIGKYAVDNLEQITRHYPNCTIPLYVVMPNHIHAIVIVADTIENNANHVETMCTSSKNTTVQDDRTYVETMCTSSLHNQRWKNGMVDEKMQSVSIKRGKLSTMVGGYKRAITLYANENKMDFGWQARFHDHIVRDQEEMNRIADYIQNNVRRWKEDRFYTALSK
jgi:REP element-mobilizing transposase RayT